MPKENIIEVWSLIYSSVLGKIVIFQGLVKLEGFGACDLQRLFTEFIKCTSYYETFNSLNGSRIGNKESQLSSISQTGSRGDVYIVSSNGNGLSKTLHDLDFDDNQNVIRSLAEVNTLSSDHGPLRWVPVVENVIPIIIHRKKVGTEEVFEVNATTGNGTFFNTEINLKEIRLKKTSECFVQWRNRKSKNAWGLNFISEEEAKKFMDFCYHARVRTWSSNSSSTWPQSSSNTISPTKESNPSTKHPNSHDNRTQEHHGSSNTLVSTDTSLSSYGNINDKGTIPSAETSLPPTRRNHLRSSGSHSNGSLVTRNNDSLISSSGLDSGFGLEEEENSSSRPESRISLEANGNELIEQSVDTSGRLHENSASALEDSTEMSYYREMQRLNRDESLEISASFHEDNDLASSSGIETDVKPRSGIAQSRQGGGTRKAGWLSGKHVFTRGKGNKIELASDRKWRKYWITLKSAALNFYQCNEKTVSAQDLDDPSFSLEIDSCIAQAVPEHAKLDHVFSVSTRLGDAYYFQAANQTDLENWITAVHSMAASLLMGSRQKSKDEMIQNLTERIDHVNEKIASDSRLKKMAELQSTVVTDSKMKQQFADQISRWEQNLEKLNISLYRLQCYMSAVKGTPLPNPQTPLACVARTTKQSLSRLGTFSVMSFHAFVSARDPSTEEEVKARNKAKRNPTSVGKIKSAIFTSLRINDAASVKSIRDRYSSKNTTKGGAKLKRSNLDNIPDTLEEDESESRSLSSSHSDWKSLGSYLRISLPNNQSTVIAQHNKMTVQDVVVNTCEKRQLEPRAYFLKLGIQEADHTIEYFIPIQDALLENQEYTMLKLCPKCVYEVELTKSLEADGLGFGISVMNRNGTLYISRVERGGLAHVQGVMADDEILAVNDVEVGDVENNPLEDLKGALRDPSIKLKLRSPRDEPPVTNKVTSDTIINSLVIRPPPKLSDNIDYGDLSDMIVPPPLMDFDDGDTGSVFSTDSVQTTSTQQNADRSSKTVDELLQQAEQVTIFCRQQMEYSEDDSKAAIQLTDAQKLRKVIIELVDTEKSYVKDLTLLLNRYLDPLKDENFMSEAEVKALVSTVHEILDFQKTFLKELENVVDSETGFDAFEEIPDFQNVILAIGELFLQYTEHFKLYSAFCSSHSRVVELLAPGQNQELRDFLDARNPKNQHSGTLESYFIKPIQRILRYPLLMRTILKLLEKDSDEYQNLLEAVEAVEKVATHINEMQRITEKFAPLFNQVVEEFGGFEVSDVMIDKLLHHGKGMWLNCPDEPRSGTLKLKSPTTPRISKKNSVMHIFVFEKVVILIHLEVKSRKKEKNTSLKASEEVKFRTLIPVTSLVLRDHCWATDETLQSWELVNISDTTELGRQECTYLFANKTAAEKREVVRSIKEAIKRGIKAGSTAASATRSHSFRRNVANIASLNSTFPGTGNFLRAQPDSNLLRRSFSHNPEEARTRRTSLIDGEHRQHIARLRDAQSVGNMDEVLSERVSVVVKDDPAKPVHVGKF